MHHGKSVASYVQKSQHQKCYVKEQDAETESKVPFSPATPQHRRQSCILFYCSFSWVTFAVKVWNHLDVLKRDDLRLSLITLNIMPVINRIFLLVCVNNVLYLSKIFKNTILQIKVI
jgi:hypothetical protein